MPTLIRILLLAGAALAGAAPAGGLSSTGAPSAATAPMPSGDPSLTGYRDGLAAVREHVEEASGSEEAARISLEGLPVMIRDEKGTLRLDASWLALAIDSLGHAGPDAFAAQKARVLGTIDGVLAESGADAAPLPLDRTSARVDLREILERRAFRSQERERVPGWLRTILDKLGGVPDWTLEAIPYVLAGLAAVLLVYMLVLVARSAMPRSKGPPGVPGFEADEAAEPEAAPGSAKLLARAEAMRRDGRYRESVRYGYLALLALLDEAGILERRPGRTNREWLRLLPATGRGDLVPGAASLTRRFEWAWYGGAEPSPEEAAGYQEEYERVASSVTAGVEEPAETVERAHEEGAGDEVRTDGEEAP